MRVVSNGSGSYPTTPAAVMCAYDKLPPAVRRALADAVFHWATQPFLTRLRRDGYSPEEIVELIAELEREELARYERKRRTKK